MEKTKKVPWGTVLALALKSSKMIKVLKALKVLKAVKSAKYLVTAFTMLLSAIVYGAHFGFWFGAGLVALIFIHEMGHVWAMQTKGYPTKAPIFIPLLGAVIFAPPMHDRDEESYIGFGGPLIGTIGALIMWAVWYVMPTHPQLLLLLSYFGVYINLLNLLPIRPLDGGRILQSVGSWYKWIGIVLLSVFLYMIQHPGLLLIFMLSVDDFVPNLRTRSRYMFIIYILMIAGYIVGPGMDAEFWVDIIVGALVLGSSYGFYRYKVNNGEDFTEVVTDERAYPPVREKVKWAASYLVLLVVLVALIAIMHQQIAPFLEQQK